MKLRWVEREVFEELEAYGFTYTKETKVKVLQCWVEQIGSLAPARWVDVPLEVEEV